MPKHFFYEDLLKQHSKRMNHYFLQKDEEGEEKPESKLVVGIHTHPGDGVDLFHRFNIVETKGEEKKADQIENEVKCKISKDFWHLSTHLTKSAMEFGFCAAPNNMNDEEKSLIFHIGGKFNPLDKSHNAIAAFKIGSPKFGPMRLWLNTHFIHEKEKHVEKFDHTSTIKNSLNVQVEDNISFGYQIEHDLTDFKKIHVRGIFDQNKINAFALGDIKNKQVTLGFSDNHHQCEKIATSSEFMYDFSGSQESKDKGFRGMPFTFAIVGEAKLTDNITIKSKIAAEKEVMVENAVLSKVNKNLTVVATNHYNFTKFVHEPKDFNLGIGCQIYYHF